MNENIDFDAIWDYGAATGWEQTRLEALQQVQIAQEDQGEWLAISARVYTPTYSFVKACFQTDFFFGDKEDALEDYLENWYTPRDWGVAFFVILVSTASQAVNLDNIEFVLLDDGDNRWRNPFSDRGELSQSTFLGTTIYSQTAFIVFQFEDNPPHWDEMGHFSLYAIRKDRTERVGFEFILAQ